MYIYIHTHIHLYMYMFALNKELLLMSLYMCVVTIKAFYCNWNINAQWHHSCHCGGRGLSVFMMFPISGTRTESECPCPEIKDHFLQGITLCLCSFFCRDAQFQIPICSPSSLLAHLFSALAAQKPSLCQIMSTLHEHSSAGCGDLQKTGMVCPFWSWPFPQLLTLVSGFQILMSWIFGFRGIV